MVESYLIVLTEKREMGLHDILSRNCVLLYPCFLRVSCYSFHYRDLQFVFLDILPMTDRFLDILTRGESFGFTLHVLKASRVSSSFVFRLILFTTFSSAKRLPEMFTKKRVSSGLTHTLSEGLACSCIPVFFVLVSRLPLPTTTRLSTLLWRPPWLRAHLRCLPEEGVQSLQYMCPCTQTHVAIITHISKGH